MRARPLGHEFEPPLWGRKTCEACAEMRRGRHAGVATRAFGEAPFMGPRNVRGESGDDDDDQPVQL